MSVDDSMDEGVDVCIVVYGQAVKLSDGHQTSAKPNQAHFYAHNYGIGIHNPAD